jgi:hypothetical protein
MDVRGRICSCPNLTNMTTATIISMGKVPDTAPTMESYRNSIARTTYWLRMDSRITNFTNPDLLVIFTQKRMDRIAKPICQEKVAK